jgi:phosphoserine aminotransferase
MAGLVFDYIEKNGGVKAMGERNEYKASLIYDFLDNSKLFKPTAEKDSRSIMNITFLLPTDALNDAFVKGATKNGLLNLKGHRSVGGMRASIYNAVTIEGVRTLVEYMKKFETENA